MEEDGKKKGGASHLPGGKVGLRLSNGRRADRFPLNVILGLLFNEPDALEDVRDVVDATFLNVQRLGSSVQVDGALLRLFDERHELFCEQAQRAARAIQRRRRRGRNDKSKVRSCADRSVGKECTQSAVTLTCRIGTSNLRGFASFSSLLLGKRRDGNYFLAKREEYASIKGPFGVFSRSKRGLAIVDVDACALSRSGKQKIVFDGVAG